MNKKKFIENIRNKFSARLHMSVICLITIASGILVSKACLYAGLSIPMWRYAIAVISSYFVFFISVYFWLRIYFGPRSQQIEDDLVDTVADVYLESPSNTGARTSWSGQGGNTGGAGASTTWGESGESSSSNDFSLSEAEELAALVAIIALIAAVLGSAGYLIVQGPEILFEAAFEIVLAASLVKNAKRMQSEGWKYSVFKKTWWLCAIVLVLAMIFGDVITAQCPEASSFAQYREMCLKE